MEVCVAIYQHGKLINRGFMVGPLCPIYGIGTTLIAYFLGRYQNDILVLFCMSMILCSALEYFTSYIMEKIFKNRWWDYSEKKYNINGRICLDFSFAFGALAVIVLHILNPFFYSILEQIPFYIQEIVVAILCIIFIVDFIVSFNIILTLKNISSSIKEDSTEAITKKVKQILLSKDGLYKRLVESFPMMQVSNVRSILKEKITRNKLQLKKEKKKLKENRSIFK